MELQENSIKKEAREIECVENEVADVQKTRESPENFSVVFGVGFATH